MKVIRVTIALGMLTFLFQSCKKEKFITSHEVENEINCIDYGFFGGNLVYQFGTFEHLNYTAADFNPFNPNELIYTEQFYYYSPTYTKKRVYYYNLLTKKKTRLYTNADTPENKLIWSRFDYIFLILWQGQTAVIVFNNDAPFGASPIPNVPQRTFPFLGYDEPYYYQYTFYDGGFHLWRKHLYNNTPFDTLGTLEPKPTEVFGQKMATKQVIDGKQLIGYFDLAGEYPLTHDDFIPIAELNGLLASITWHANGQYLYVSQYNLDGEGKGLYRIDMNGNVDLLVEYCTSKYYQHIKCSPDGTKLLGNRISTKYKDVSNPSAGYYRRIDMAFIDLNTLKETIIKFD